MASPFSLSPSEPNHPASENRRKPCLSKTASATSKAKKHSWSLSAMVSCSDSSLLQGDAALQTLGSQPGPSPPSPQIPTDPARSRISPELPMPALGSRGPWSPQKVPFPKINAFPSLFLKFSPDTAPGLILPVLH